MYQYIFAWWLQVLKQSFFFCCPTDLIELGKPVFPTLATSSRFVALALHHLDSSIYLVLGLPLELLPSAMNIHCVEAFWLID